MRRLRAATEYMFKTKKVERFKPLPSQLKNLIEVMEAAANGLSDKTIEHAFLTCRRGEDRAQFQETRQGRNARLCALSKT
jgi:hypothetical protein